MPANDNARRVTRVVTILLTAEDEMRIEQLAAMYDGMTPGRYLRRKIGDHLFVPASQITIRERAKP